MTLNKILIIESKWYPDQNPNNLSVYLDEEIQNAESIRIIYAGIPCTFFNIYEELKNNNFAVDDGNGWKYIHLEDGFYDLRSFNKQFSIQMKKMNYAEKAIMFDLNETSGKINIIFKQTKKDYKLSVRNYNADLLGFNVPKNGSIELPRRIRDSQNPKRFIREKISVGDRPINFKPFDYFHIHCDIIDTKYILYNGIRSDVLVRIPAKECDFGEINTYYLTGLRNRKCVERFNKIRIWVTDENNQPIDFNGTNIQYELLIN
jgi:hypothetical protein